MTLDDVPPDTSLDLHTTAGRLKDLANRTEEAVHAGSARAVEKQHAKGKLTARERVERLLDEGSFVELDALARHRSTQFGQDKNRPYGDGVVTGYGTVDGRTVAVERDGVRLFTPMMLEAARQDPQWRGHIVNTASMAGMLAPPNMAVYNVSKHAVVALTETLYQDLRLVTDQVHCSLLCPYFVPTGIADSERNRPADMSNATLTGSQKVARAMSQKAVGSGKVTATHIAEKVFAAMAEEQFYIFSHPHALGNVQARMEDILQLRNPTDAFAGRPEVGQQLREALRAAAAAA